VGSWKVTWTCGTEALQLNADGTFSHSVKPATGAQTTDSGAWSVTPRSELLQGATVVLQNALQLCSVFGEKFHTAAQRTS
jgi:hypothetical protein